MAKYHLNPFTGEPNPCKAVKGKCPWGGKTGEENHFLTKEAARAAYEIAMKEEEQTSIRLSNEARILEYETLHNQEKQEKEERYKTPEERGYLSLAETERISTEGITCPECHHQLNSKQAALLLDESQWTTCHGCGAQIDLYNVDLTVGRHKDTFPALDKTKVPELIWSHSTTASDWEERAGENTGFYAHLGSEQAALDRAIAERNYVKNEEGVSGFWLYDVKVAPDSKIADTILADGNEGYGEYNAENKAALPLTSRSSETDLDVIRYFNKWEDMASISLVANTKKIKIVGKRFVPKKDALKSRSLYNIDPLEAQIESTSPYGVIGLEDLSRLDGIG